MSMARMTHASIWMISLAVTCLWACSEPTAGTDLTADYALVSTRLGGTLPDVLIYAKNILGSDTVGYVDRGSLRLEGGKFVATFVVRPGKKAAGPVETQTCTGKFKFESRGEGGSPLDPGIPGYKIKVMIFSATSGELLGHRLGRPDVHDPDDFSDRNYDAFISDDYKKVTIYYQGNTYLNFVITN